MENPGPKPRTFVDGRMNPAATAAYLGLSTKTLAAWRCTGGGPPFVKPGGRIYYYRSDIDEWMAARRALTTAQARQQAARKAV